MKRLVALALVAVSSVAYAHGGLPVTAKILRQADGDTMYVPVVFWGVWIGDGAKPWKWICEEEINLNRGRHVALSTDGTFYATDTRGLTVSTDKGCTWKPIAMTLEPGAKRLTDVAVDPVDGMTAWVTSAESGGAAPDGGVLPGNNAVYVTHDHGVSFQRLPGLQSESARLFQSVKPGPTGQTLYAVSTALDASPVNVHRSDDGGTTFQTYPLTYKLNGVQPYTGDLMAVDPRVPTTVYLRVFTSGLDSDGSPVARHVLLRSIDGGMSFSELATVDGVLTPAGGSRGIDGVSIDTGRGKVLVATSKGLLSGEDPDGKATAVTLGATGNLSQTQCVDVHKGGVYACANDFAPDFAALARSDDGAMSFRSILEYENTQGPVDCPAGTPVGDMCPLYWQMYGSQLGVNMSGVDGGAGDGGSTNMGGRGCSCDVGGASRSAAYRAFGPPYLRRGPMPAVAVALVLLAFALRRRARR